MVCTTCDEKEIRRNYHINGGGGFPASNEDWLSKYREAVDRVIRNNHKKFYTKNKALRNRGKL